MVQAGLNRDVNLQRFEYENTKTFGTTDLITDFIVKLQIVYAGFVVVLV